MARRDQRNPFADEFGNHVNHELVNRTCVEKRGNDAGATHHPNVLSLFLLQSGSKAFEWFAHELDARRCLQLRGIACEHVILDSCIEDRPGATLLLEIQRDIVRLSTPQNRINRLIERAHAVVTLGSWPVEPIDTAVRTGNKAVSTHSDIDDDFALADHICRRTSNQKVNFMKLRISR